LVDDFLGGRFGFSFIGLAEGGVLLAFKLKPQKTSSAGSVTLIIKQVGGCFYEQN